MDFETFEKMMRGKDTGIEEQAKALGRSLYTIFEGLTEGGFDEDQALCILISMIDAAFERS